jgi:hypothetical protein
MHDFGGKKNKRSRKIILSRALSILLTWIDNTAYEHAFYLSSFYLTLLQLLKPKYCTSKQTWSTSLQASKWECEDHLENLKLTTNKVAASLGTPFSDTATDTLSLPKPNPLFVITDRRNQISEVIESRFHIEDYFILAVWEAVAAMIDCTSHFSLIASAGLFTA